MVSALVAFAAASATRCRSEAMGEVSGLVQLERKTSRSGRKALGSASSPKIKAVSLDQGFKNAKELEVRLRKMAVAKATNGSVKTNYTVFQLNESDSEATLQIINNSMTSFLDQVNTSFHIDLQEIQDLIENAEACNDDLSAEQTRLGLSVTAVNQDVVDAEIAHDQCREQQQDTYTANVTAFDALRNTIEGQLDRIDNVPQAHQKNTQFSI